MNKGEEAKTEAIFTLQGEFRCILLWNNMLFCSQTSHNPILKVAWKETTCGEHQIPALSREHHNERNNL